MSRLADEHFAVVGLAPSHAFLVMSVNDNPGIGPSQLSTELQLTPSTITRFLEKLEAKDFVKRTSVGKNTEVYPTLKGKARDKEIREAWKALKRSYRKLLGKELADGLIALLSEVNEPKQD